MLQAQDIQELIRQCTRGNAQAQEMLYRYAYSDMMRVCHRYAFTADDASVLFNEAMLKVFQNLNMFRADGNIMAWIRKIVVNTCLDYCRKRMKEQKTMQHMDADEDLNCYVAPEVYHSLSADDILSWINALPPPQGVVLKLFAVEGYSHKEIAGILSIAETASQWWLREARKNLKEIIERHYGTPKTAAY